MLRSLKGLEGYTMRATDGDIGGVADFLLDDERWVVRYLVADTAVFAGRRVLISPISFGDVEWSTRCFHLALSMEKIRNSPSVDADKPVSRQHEWEYYRYFGYPDYWGYPGLWGTGAYPGLLSVGRASKTPAEHSDRASGDIHLRSASEVRGYHIQGNDEAIGHVEDFIVDDETWEVRYLVVDTSNWWFGKKVLLAPRWTSRVSWSERKVHVDLSRQAISNGPEWNPNAAVNREYEARLYDYYGRPVYWDGDDRSAPTPHRPGSHPG
jgi:sporulation protein YlmC with PRC-barrel domain